MYRTEMAVFLIVTYVLPLPPLASLEAAGICTPTGNTDVLLAAVYKSTRHARRDAAIIELLSFWRKPALTGDLNAKHPFEHSEVLNP
jgi:hypothetical protein